MLWGVEHLIPLPLHRLFALPSLPPESSRPSQTIQRLPPEIWLLIAEWLDHDTLDALMSLNHTFFCMAMDSRWRRLSIKGYEREQTLRYLEKLFSHLNRSRKQVGPRIRSVYASDDILQAFLPPGKRVFRYPMSQLINPKQGPLGRLRSLYREFQVGRSTVPALRHCTNVEHLELVLNGPWLAETSSDPGSYRKLYFDYTFVDEILNILCHAFQKNLKQLTIKMQHAGSLTRVLQASALKFPQLTSLELDLAKLVFQREPVSTAFAEFIAQFHLTLQVLKLRFDNIGPDSLLAVLGMDKPVFPRLHTLELNDCGNRYDERRGFSALTPFLHRIPDLQHFHLMGPRFTYWGNENFIEPFNFPPGLALESFGTNEAAWRIHHASLGTSFDKLPPKKLVFRQRNSLNIFGGVFDNASFLKNITDLHLETDQFQVDTFIPGLVSHFPLLKAFSASCEYVSLPLHGTVYPSNRSDISSLVLDSVDPNQTYASSKLTSVDIYRRTPHRHRRLPLSCQCSEIRIWAVMKVFALHFPSIQQFAGKCRAELEDFKTVTTFCCSPLCQVFYRPTS